MSQLLRTLKARKAAALDEARAISAKAETENRAFTPEESARFNALMDEVDKDGTGLNAQIAQLERAAALGMGGAPAGQQQQPAAGRPGLGTAVPLAGDGRQSFSEDNRIHDPARGFSSRREYFSAVVAAGTGGGRGALDERLLIGATAPGLSANEGSGADGGFLVPPEYAQELYTLSLSDDALLPLVDEVSTMSNSMVFPKDETTPWGSDGVRSYWQVEATLANATKPVVSTSTLRMHKLMGLVPVTQELMQDAVSLDSYITPLIGRSIKWKSNEAILLGDGVGKPYGMMSSAAAVTVAKETSQAAGSLLVDNITKMVARLPSGSFGNSIWLITNDLLPRLFGMTVGTSGAAFPVYLPVSSGMQASPYGTLMGRPIWVSQHAAAAGSEGDLMLLDGSYYRALTHRSGMQIDSSMHLYFDSAAMALRVIFRLDGAPKISKPIDQAKGSNQLSPFVKLGARA